MKLRSVLNGVMVAPHGITDLIHAFHYRNMNNLMKIYTSTFLVSESANIIQHHYPKCHVLDMLFLFASAVHFQHDMPSSKNIHPLVLSSLFISFTPVMGIDIFTLYMICIHVPRHYAKTWKFIKYYKIQMLVLIALLSIPGITLSEHIFELQTNIQVLMEWIILAHVYYNEKYLDGKVKDKNSL